MADRQIVDIKCREFLALRSDLWRPRGEPNHKLIFLQNTNLEFLNIHIEFIKSCYQLIFFLFENNAIYKKSNYTDFKLVEFFCVIIKLIDFF